MTMRLKVLAALSLAALLTTVAVLQYRNSVASSREATLRSQQFAAREAADRRLATGR